MRPVHLADGLLTPIRLPQNPDAPLFRKPRFLPESPWAQEILRVLLVFYLGGRRPVPFDQFVHDAGQFPLTLSVPPHG
jgi:hypothetical protein